MAKARQIKMRAKARQIKMRIPDGAQYAMLLKRLIASAEKNGCSINNEILHRLEQSFDLPNLEDLVRGAVADGIGVFTGHVKFEERMRQDG